MRIQPIAAGDSLVWTATVPAAAGSMSEMTFDVAAERSDRGITVTGSVENVNVSGRTVTIKIPARALTVGLWQVQARATTLDFVTTFILCGIIDVTRSLLPLPEAVTFARLVLSPLRLSAEVNSEVVGAIGTLVLPRLGVSAAGNGMLPFVEADIRFANLGIAASGTPYFLSDADVAFSPIGVDAIGAGFRAGATADVRIAPLLAEGYGAGSVGEGSVDIRWSPLAASALGSGLTPQATADATLFVLRASSAGVGLRAQADGDIGMAPLSVAAAGVGFQQQATATVSLFPFGVSATVGAAPVMQGLPRALPAALGVQSGTSPSGLPLALPAALVAA